MKPPTTLLTLLTLLINSRYSRSSLKSLTQPTMYVYIYVYIYTHTHTLYTYIYALCIYIYIYIYYINYLGKLAGSLPLHLLRLMFFFTLVKLAGSRPIHLWMSRTSSIVSWASRYPFLSVSSLLKASTSNTLATH